MAGETRLAQDQGTAMAEGIAQGGQTEASAMAGGTRPAQDQGTAMAEGIAQGDQNQGWKY